MCKFMRKVVKKMDFWDFGLMKGAGFFFGLFVAYYAPQLSQYMYYWLALAVLMALKPMYDAYIKK